MAIKLGKNLTFSLKDGFTILMEKAGRQENLKTTIVERQLYRFNNTIGDWRNAQSKAEDLLTPSRVELIRVYNEVVLDNHLSALMESRTLRVTGHKFNMEDSEGNVDDEKTALMSKSWMHQFIRLAMESKYWGYNLIQFDDLEDFEFKTMCPFPKQNVEPRTERLRVEHNMLDGIPYNDEPFNNWTFFIGDPEDLGLLNKAAPMTIWKKDALGSWADFAIMFGVPPRIGKTNTRDKKMRTQMFEALQSMGRAFFSVIDKDDEIELIDTKRTDAHGVFDKLTERANSEMSKLILGQTMTMDDGSSRSQSEVHERSLEMITKADCIWIENLINNDLIPWLIKDHGFPLEGLVFGFDMTDQLTLTEQMEMTKELLDHYTIPEDWILTKFGIPVEAKAEPADAPEGGDGGGDEPKEMKVSQSLLKSVKEYFGNVPEGMPENAAGDSILSAEEENQLYTDIYSGAVTTTALPIVLYDATAAQVNKGVVAGYGGGLSDFAQGSSEQSLLSDLRVNVYEFSAAKTYQQVRSMSEMLYDSNGILVPFEQFKAQAQEIFGTFNENWLRTEFRTAVAQSQGAHDWLRIKDQQSELPLLVYNTMTDNRVRDEHIDLEGITRPVNDNFWTFNYPPNGWNCRCFVDQTDEGTITPVSSFSMGAFEETPPVFRMNAGKDRIVFKANHPYFRTARGEEFLKEVNFGLQIPVE